MKTEVLRIQGLCAERLSGCNLQNVYMNLYQGEALGLVGLHETGKSFLFDCLTGKKKASKGKIFLYEEGYSAREWTKPNKIFRIQEQSSLVETQSVTENVFVIRKRRKRQWIVHWNLLKQETASLVRDLGIEIDPKSVVSELTLVERHIVEILKAYISGGCVILIDDILAAYTTGDYDVLYRVIRRFQEKGISFIICACQLEKLQRLTDRCLFMVNGTTVKVMSNIRRKQLNQIKVLMGSSNRGIQINKNVRAEKWTEGQILFAVNNIKMTSGEMMNFQIRAGEIVVIVDFFHQWIPQLVKMISGKRSAAGSFILEGKEIKSKSKKIYISDFLESNYMVDSLSLRDNLCLAAFKKISTFGFLHPKKVRVIERIFREQYKISEEDFPFNWGRLSFAEKMAVYLERIKLQKWNVMFCTNIENVMSYELEDMIITQLRDMVRGRRAICVCASSFEKYSRLADYFLFVTEDKQIRKFTYPQLCEYFKI